MSSIAAWAGAAVFAIAAVHPQSSPPSGQRPPDAPAAAGRAVQPAAPGRLAGRVTAPDGRPIARARITVTSDVLAAPRAALTDSQGRFTIEGLPPGHYSAAAVRTGYVPQPFGGASAAAIDLTQGQQLASIDFVLPPAGAISGRILDEDNSPLGGAIVSALRSAIEGGRRAWTTAATTSSDDRGEFRLFGLGAGTYLVSATDPAFEHAASEHGTPVYAPTYYPGVISPDAARQVVVDPADAPARVEFRLHLVPPSQVSGRVTSWNERELLSAAVIISPQDGRSASTAVGEARITPDGSFTFSNVPAGRYVIRARGETDREGASLFATFVLAVEGHDITGVDLVLTPGGTMEGRVSARAKHGYPAPVLHGLRVRAPLADGTLFGDTLTGTVAQDGEFRLSGMVAGAHVLAVEGLDFPWRIEQATAQGRDFSSTAFDTQREQQFRGARILLTDTAAGVSGTVTLPPPLIPADVLVVAFPADALKRRLIPRFVRHARPAAGNTYRLLGLPPGDYLVAAVIGMAEDEVVNPIVLDALAEIASPVTLVEAQVASLPLSARPMQARVPSP